MSPYTDLLLRMTSRGAHLVPLISAKKQPMSERWPMAAALTVNDAEVHLERGGNVGINLASSRMICLDAENYAATAAVKNAGFTLTVIPAKAQAPYATNPHKDKRGGSHTWLRIPDGIDPVTLRSVLGIKLPNGGIIDMLAGPRFAVAPPSQLDEAPGYQYAPAAGGVLDPGSGIESLPVAPMWLFDAARMGGAA